MSFDLEVVVPETGKNFSEEWASAFTDFGINCEFRPDFDTTNWSGTDFIAKIQVITDSFKGAKSYGVKPVVVGCGMDRWPPKSKDAKEIVRDLKSGATGDAKKILSKKNLADYFFSSSHGRGPANYRFQVAAAATLANLTGGLFSDPQEGALLTGKQAIDWATRHLSTFDDSKERWKPIPFTTWDKVLKDAIPSLNEI